MTKKLYLYENAPLKTVARIVQIDTLGPQTRIRLDQTIFHVKGGGQLADTGVLGAIRVIDVRHAEGGDVDHLVDSLDAETRVGQTVALVVDEERRIQNTRLHSAGHLIAGVMDAPFPQVKPLGAHHYPGECRVEFTASADLIDAVRAALPNLLAEAIAHDLPVRVIGNPEQTRAIQIGDLPPIPCGGTHVRSLAELRHVEITNLKMKDGKLRISYQLEEPSPRRT